MTMWCTPPKLGSACPMVVWVWAGVDAFRVRLAFGAALERERQRDRARVCCVTEVVELSSVFTGRSPKLRRCSLGEALNRVGVHWAKP